MNQVLKDLQEVEEMLRSLKRRVLLLQVKAEDVGSSPDVRDHLRDMIFNVGQVEYYTQRAIVTEAKNLYPLPAFPAQEREEGE